MSISQVIGTIAGAVLGYFTGGAGWYLVAAVMMGAAAGFAAGSMVDGMAPDVPSPGQSQTGEVDITSVAYGIQINDVMGLAKVVGNMFYYCRSRSKAIKEKQSTGGKGGGDKTEKVIVGYKYYLTWCTGLCMGPVDELLAVYRNEDQVWQGNVSPDADGRETTITLENMGSMTIYWGTDTQVKPSQLDAYLGTTNSAYRGFCWAFHNDNYLGKYNRVPIMRYIIRKTVPHSWSIGDYGIGHLIGGFQYNPADAMYYVLQEMGFSESWMDVDSFIEVHDTMYSESRGVIALLSQEQNGLTYLESIVNHFGLMLRYGVDGKFYLKAIRDESLIGLPEVNADEDLLEPIALDTRQWSETINEIKLQYTEVILDEGT